MKSWDAAKSERETVQNDLLAQIDLSKVLLGKQKNQLKKSAENALGLAPENSEATYAGIARATKDEIIYLEGRRREAVKKQSTVKREFAETKRYEHLHMFSNHDSMIN